MYTLSHDQYYWSHDFKWHEFSDVHENNVAPEWTVKTLPVLSLTQLNSYFKRQKHLSLEFSKINCHMINIYGHMTWIYTSSARCMKINLHQNELRKPFPPYSKPNSIRTSKSFSIHLMSQKETSVSRILQNRISGKHGLNKIMPR